MVEEEKSLFKVVLIFTRMPCVVVRMRMAPIGLQIWIVIREWHYLKGFGDVALLEEVGFEVLKSPF